ncbi:unnamed protein product, partial [Aphanomyces euteiches]
STPMHVTRLTPTSSGITTSQRSNFATRLTRSSALTRVRPPNPNHICGNAWPPPILTSRTRPFPLSRTRRLSRPLYNCLH